METKGQTSWRAAGFLIDCFPACMLPSSDYTGHARPFNISPALLRLRCTLVTRLFPRPIWPICNGVSGGIGEGTSLACDELDATVVPGKFCPCSAEGE